MKHCLRMVLIPVLALTMALAPLAKARQAAAQDVKPIAVVSLASVDELMQDATYLTKAAGMPEAVGLLQFVVVPFTQGVDTKRPAGAYVTLAGMEPAAVGFIPVSDFNI